MKPTIKAKFNNKTKGLLSSKIKDYQSLVNTIKTQFTQLKQPFKMYYNESDIKICIDDQDDYNHIDFNTNLYIYISQQMGCQDISRIQSSKSASKDNLQDSVLNIMTNSSLQQSQQVVIINQKEQEKPIKTSKHQQFNRSQKYVSQQERNIKTIIKPKQSIQKESNQYEQIKIQPASILNQSIDCSGNLYKGKCAACETTLIVQKWKCPSKNGSNFDICQKCYDKQKCVDINDQSFWPKINYSHAIAKMFDSKYNKQKQLDSLEIEEWISQQDILKKKPNFMNRVYSCSEHMVNTIVSNFNQWERDYQSKLQQVKSK